jgi:hypothetical protein
MRDWKACATHEAFSKPRSSRGNEAHSSSISRNMEPPHVGCYSFAIGSRSADIPVGGFGRLSSRPMLPVHASRPRTVSRACCPKGKERGSVTRSGFRSDWFQVNSEDLRAIAGAAAHRAALQTGPGDLGNTPSRCTPREKSRKIKIGLDSICPGVGVTLIKKIGKVRVAPHPVFDHLLPGAEKEILCVPGLR